MNKVVLPFFKSHGFSDVKVQENLQKINLLQRLYELKLIKAKFTKKKNIKRKINKTDSFKFTFKQI